MSITGRRWRLRGRAPEGVPEGGPYPALVRHLLWHRGVRTAADASRFIEAPGPTEYDPMLLPGMAEALSRLRHAISSGETVAVFGDFDVDGVTASALLTQGLSALGGKVVPYIPDRFSEGYGLTTRALDTLHAAGAGLVLTADCGTSSPEEVEHAGRLGMAVVIIDHHTVPRETPAGPVAAVATVNPKREDSQYPERELTSVGLAYKLMGALYESLGRAWEPSRYLDLVALGTVADVAPLLNENRWLVKRGLASLARTSRPGLRALMEASGIDPRLVDAEAIGYALGPRLNAAGRLAHARLAFDLLLEEDEEEARRRALELTSLNEERRRQTSAAMALAQELLEGEDREAPLIFIGHGDISAGIVGLVAGRLAEERYRPAVVFEQRESTSRGSCRSIPEFDITSALRQCAPLMVKFGGHHQAAGFTAENEKLAALKESLLRTAGELLAGVELAPVIDIDAALPLRGLRGEEIRWLWRLGPFGQGNREPTFLSRGVQVLDARAIGSDGHHLRLKLKDGPVTWPAIAFGLGPASPVELNVEPGQRLDVVYSLAADRGSEGALELRVKDVAPSQQA